MDIQDKFNLIRECVANSHLSYVTIIELNNFLDDLEELQEEE